MTSTEVVAGRPVECDVIARGESRAGPSGIAALRKSPGGRAVPATLLKHADEQTVVALDAVFRAIGAAGLDPGGFEEWAVLACPRFLGRSAFERAFPDFRAEGAWGVSPHLIPSHSLHSPSGTISQALNAHGPNLGAGGSPGGGREALLFAATLLRAGPCPGAWVVFTGRLGELDGSEQAGDYEALALALTPSKPDFPGPRLLISPVEVRALGMPDFEGMAARLPSGLVRFDPPQAIPGPIARRPRATTPRGTP